MVKQALLEAADIGGEQPTWFGVIGAGEGRARTYAGDPSLVSCVVHRGDGRVSRSPRGAVRDVLIRLQAITIPKAPRGDDVDHAIHENVEVRGRHV